MPSFPIAKSESWKMFNAISPTYDRVNRIMTGGLDLLWRKKVAKLVPKTENLSVLDLATGTCDQLLALFTHAKNIKKAIGLDLAQQMLNIGRQKLDKTAFANQVELIHGSACELPFAQELFDCITISFGIRNVPDLDKCFQEMIRTLKKGGRAIILETSMPQNSLLKALYLLYFRHILPKIGGLLSKNYAAYCYLNQTSEAFPCGSHFCKIMEKNGFVNVKALAQLGGLTTIYIGEKL